MEGTKSRVKVYELDVESNWADKGTGHVEITYVEVCASHS